jgi:hypothetical protein
VAVVVMEVMQLVAEVEVLMVAPLAPLFLTIQIMDRLGAIFRENLPPAKFI